MGIFKGSFYSQIQESHQFFSKSEILKNIGLSSFTKNSCSIIYNRLSKNIRSLYPNANPPFPEEMNSDATILDLAEGTDNGYYIKFNTDTKIFEETETSIPLDEVLDLIDYHEDIQQGIGDADEDLDNKIKEINISLEKSVIFRGVLNNEDIVIQLFFQSKDRRSNERIVVQKNDIRLAAIPCTPFGKHYSIKSFEYDANFGSTPSDKVSNVGTIISANNDTKNFPYPPKSWQTAQKHFYTNSVAAPIQLSYDSNTNTWKSGNSNCLARLLEDLPAAPVQSLQDIDENITDAKLWLDSNSDNYVGGFTTAKAVPLSLERGNPHLFGPNFTKEEDGKKLVTLKVVNRAAKAFAKGTIVMLTEINGEWIVQDFGITAPTTTPLKVGEWTFTKLIANSDAYFKYDQFRSNGNPLITVSDAIYSRAARSVFYNNVRSVLANSYTKFYKSEEINNIISLNIGTNPQPEITFIPSKNYLISSIFDQLPPSHGGFNNNNTIKILYNNNFSSISNIDDVMLNPVFFWGPIFSEGYTSLIYNPTPSGSNLYNVSNIDRSRPIEPHLRQQFAKDSQSDIYKQIPAELTAKLFESTYFFNNYNNLGKRTFLMSEASMVVRPPYYGSVSKNNSVQFSPICLEFIGSNFTVPGVGVVQPANNLQYVARTYANTLSNTSNIAFNLFGGMISRSKQHGYAPDEIELLCTIKRENTITKAYSNKGGLGAQQMPNLTTYSCDPDPDGGYSPGEGTHIVGIIGAKNTITKRGGGKVNFAVSQKFGSRVARSVSGGAATSVTILPIGGGIGWSNPGQPPGIQSFPTWGSSEDAVHSFGTLTLNVKIFDAWPESQTIYDARYFNILHFNPGDLASTSGSTPVDFTNPVASGQTDPLKTGTVINSTTQLKPSSEWAKNTVRRGQLLTNGGFWYQKNIIGLSLSAYTIEDGGSGFSVNDEIRGPKNSTIIVTSTDNGSLTGFRFKQIDTETAKYLACGENVLPSDFNTVLNPNNPNNKVFRTSISSGRPSTRAAVVSFSMGIVYAQLLKDNPPTEHTAGIRLTSSSNLGQGGGNVSSTIGGGGTGFVTGTQDSEIELPSNSNGQYDCFFHFHNDAGIYSIDELNGPVQYINLTIS